MLLCRKASLFIFQNDGLTFPLNNDFGIWGVCLVQTTTSVLYICFSVYTQTSQTCVSGLEKLGLEFYVGNPSHRLPTVTTIKVPEGVDWKSVVGHAMQRYVSISQKVLEKLYPLSTRHVGNTSNFEYFQNTVRTSAYRRCTIAPSINM